VRVTDGTGASASASLSINVVVTVPAPGAFSKTSPAFTATGRAKSGLLLTWAASAGATRYEYCIDTTNDNACGATWINVGTATSVVLGRLTGLTTYYWQVRAVNSGGITYSNNSTFWRFTTAK
ncbi:MAG: hypothetical protein RI900_2836, partial [Actinomycetota bacterium]